MESLRTTFTPYTHTRGLAEGDVTLPSFSLDFVRKDPIIAAYREMVRDLAYDICELAPTTYLLARAAGVRVTAIPIFTKRQFHHGAIQCAAGSGIHSPADLAGRTVGVRAYSVTTGVWFRGLLKDDFGVDSDTIRWVTDDEEHVASYVPPANVSAAPGGASLVDLLAEGRIDAALSGNAGTGRKGAPKEGWRDAAEESDEPAAKPYPLVADPESMERDWYARTGIYPIHAMITLRSELVERHPDLPTQLYRAFADAKASADADRAQLEKEGCAGSAIPAGEDPIPYGIAPNSRSVEALVRYAREQRLLDGDVSVESIFAPGDYPVA